MWQAILGRYPPHLRPQGPLRPLGNAGGLSGSQLWRYGSGVGEVVLRAWPRGGRSRAEVERIHGWLKRTGDLGFVPVPFAASDGSSVQTDASGRLWELAPWMSGTPDLASPPDPARVRLGFAGLASFHQRLGHERLPAASPGLASRLDELDGLRSGGFSAIEERLSTGLVTSEWTDLVRHWIVLSRIAEPIVRERWIRLANRSVVLQPCIRDARPDHFLFGNPRLTGLVDFGAMDMESVAADLARLMAEWLDDDSKLRSEALESYEAVRPLDPDERALIPAFEETAAVLAGARWIRWALEGRQFDRPNRPLEGLRKSVERIRRLTDR